jgi:hypothetical protein
VFYVSIVPENMLRVKLKMTASENSLTRRRNRAKWKSESGASPAR